MDTGAATLPCSRHSAESARLWPITAFLGLAPFEKHVVSTVLLPSEAQLPNQSIAQPPVTAISAPHFPGSPDVTSDNFQAYNSPVMCAETLVVLRSVFRIVILLLRGHSDSDWGTAWGFKNLGDDAIRQLESNLDNYGGGPHLSVQKRRSEAPLAERGDHAFVDHGIESFHHPNIPRRSVCVDGQRNSHRSF